MALIGLALRVRLLVLAVHDELNADEALPGLMARHIAFGAERPVFYYSQHYFGAAEAYLLAGLFRWLGFRPDLLFVPPIAASVLLVPVTFALGTSVGGRAGGLLAALPAAVPPPILARLHANAGGGFSLAFLLHGLVLLAALRAARASGRWVAVCWLAMLSLTGGVLIWVWQPGIATVAVSVIWLLAAQPRLRHPGWLLSGLLPLAAGLAPPIAYNRALGWPTIAALAAKYAAPANESSAGPSSALTAVAGYLVSAIGGGNEAEGRANMPLAGVVLLAALAGVWLATVQAREPRGSSHAGPRPAAVLLLAAFLVDVVAAHNTVRHLAPAALDAYALAGAGLALAVSWRRLALPVVALAVAASGWQTLALWNSAGATFQHFVARQSEAALAARALVDRGLPTGYSDYWSAYPITYLAGEEVVIAPAVPAPFGGRFDRYPAYAAIVDAEPDPARLFLLLDNQCDPLPYVLLLEQEDATFTLERLGRWYLLWGIHPAPQSDGQTLARLRQLIYAREVC